MILIQHVPIDSTEHLQQKLSEYGTVELFLTEFTNYEREQQALVKMGSEFECDFTVSCLDGDNWGDLRMCVRKIEDILDA